MQDLSEHPAAAGGWRRLSRAVRSGHGQHPQAAELGEYTSVLLQSTDRAATTLPDVARHVHSCAACHADVQAMLRLLHADGPAT